MATNFRPPLIESSIITFHQVGEGQIDRAELLIVDANRMLFTLTVATIGDFRALVQEDVTIDTEQLGEKEPIFLVPTEYIDPGMLAEVCAMPANLLALYLVEQNNAA